MKIFIIILLLFSNVFCQWGADVPTQLGRYFSVKQACEYTVRIDVSIDGVANNTAIVNPGSSVNIFYAWNFTFSNAADCTPDYDWVTFHFEMYNWNTATFSRTVINPLPPCSTRNGVWGSFAYPNAIQFRSGSSNFSFVAPQVPGLYTFGVVSEISPGFSICDDARRSPIESDSSPENIFAAICVSGDTDGDTIPDCFDNCPCDSNLDQLPNGYTYLGEVCQSRVEEVLNVGSVSCSIPEASIPNALPKPKPAYNCSVSYQTWKYRITPLSYVAYYDQQQCPQLINRITTLYFPLSDYSYNFTEEISRDFVTTGEITTQQVTTSSVTSGRVTTGRTIPQVTTSQITSGDLTTSQLINEVSSSSSSPNDSERNVIILASVLSVLIILGIGAAAVGFFVWSRRKKGPQIFELPEMKDHEMEGTSPSGEKVLWPTSGASTLEGSKGVIRGSKIKSQTEGTTSTGLGGGDYRTGTSLAGRRKSIQLNPEEAKYMFDLVNNYSGTIVKFDDLTVDKYLGKGSFGVVYKGIWKGTQIAMKELNEGLITKHTIEDFMKEAATMEGIPTHPNVVKFMGITVFPDPLILITELCSGGSLLDVMKNPKIEIIGGLLKKILVGTAKGLGHLHKNKFVHRDVAARNVLLMADMTPKVSDFGMSRKIADNASAHVTVADMGPIKWMAPESLVQKKFSKKSDAWSFAVLIYEVLEREPPFKGIPNMDVARKVVYQNEHVPIPEKAHKAIKEVMLASFEQDPKNRWTMDVIAEKLEELPDD